MNDVNRRIFELIHSTENSDKMGGLLAIGKLYLQLYRVVNIYRYTNKYIDKLIDCEIGEEDPTQLTRFANYLRIVLPGNEPHITELAAKALGRLALPGGTLTSEFVEFETKRALEWLQGLFFF